MSKCSHANFCHLVQLNLSLCIRLTELINGLPKSLLALSLEESKRTYCKSTPLRSRGVFKVSATQQQMNYAKEIKGFFFCTAAM